MVNKQPGELRGKAAAAFGDWSASSVSKMKRRRELDLTSEMVTFWSKSVTLSV